MKKEFQPNGWGDKHYISNIHQNRFQTKINKRQCNFILIKEHFSQEDNIKILTEHRCIHFNETSTTAYKVTV